MGLDFRKRSGRIANGSRLVVPGQITVGQKVFPNTFSKKSAPPSPKLEVTPIVQTQTPNPSVTPTPPPSQTPTPSITPTVTPTITPSITPSLTPTSTPTPTPSPTPVVDIIEAIIVDSETYISVGVDEYLMY